MHSHPRTARSHQISWGLPKPCDNYWCHENTGDARTQDRTRQDSWAPAGSFTTATDLGRRRHAHENTEAARLVGVHRNFTTTTGTKTETRHVTQHATVGHVDTGSTADTSLDTPLRVCLIRGLEPEQTRHLTYHRVCLTRGLEDRHSQPYAASTQQLPTSIGETLPRYSGQPPSETSA